MKPVSSERLLGAAGLSAISVGVAAYAQLPAELRVLRLPEWMQIPDVLTPEATAVVVGLMGMITIICGIEISKRFAKKYFSQAGLAKNDVRDDMWRNTLPYWTEMRRSLEYKTLSWVLGASAMLEIGLLLDVNIRYSVDKFTRDEITAINAAAAFAAGIIFLINEKFNSSSKS